jgi:hypothetical protein
MLRILRLGARRPYSYLVPLAVTFTFGGGEAVLTVSAKEMFISS